MMLSDLMVQLAGLAFRYVPEAVLWIAPMIVWWSGAEAIFLFQWFATFNVIHQIKIAHFVFVGSAICEKSFERIYEVAVVIFVSAMVNKYIPNVRWSPSVA